MFSLITLYWSQYYEWLYRYGDSSVVTTAVITSAVALIITFICCEISDNNFAESVGLSVCIGFMTGLGVMLLLVIFPIVAIISLILLFLFIFSFLIQNAKKINYKTIKKYFKRQPANQKFSEDKLPEMYEDVITNVWNDMRLTRADITRNEVRKQVLENLKKY